MINYKNFKRLNVASKACVAATLISSALIVGSFGKFTYDLIGHDKPLAKRLDFLENNTEYANIVNTERDALYQQLKLGNITSIEFENGYNEIGSDDHFINWARTLDNEEVQEIIANYDREIDETNSKLEADAYVGITATGVMLGAALTYDYVNKKRDNQLEK